MEAPIHEHPLLPVTRFSLDVCDWCKLYGYIYGGYRCNELGCGHVFHRECAEPLPEINHSSHPDHPLKLFKSDIASFDTCSECGVFGYIDGGYYCSELECESVFHTKCAESLPKIKHFFHRRDRAELFPEANHTSHPQHPLKLLSFETAPDYADENCLLCGIEFCDRKGQRHHCDVCNFSICRLCMNYPPPVRVESPTTHKHELHLVPRRIAFTCNACGTLGDRSPYFCLQCNFMIHRQCIDLPRVIHINRHDHRISYTPRLGHGEWKCKVCRKKVDGFYGAYTCKKCPSLAVHSRCATRNDIWDKVEREGMREEEEELPPFEVIDDKTINHFSHDHNLRINEDGHDRILPENIVCEACRLQIISEPFYSCEQCHFILHEKCANHPRKKRHVHSNRPFALLTDSRDFALCALCGKYFTGFRYKTGFDVIIDVRCAAISDTLEHGSHPRPLYFDSTRYTLCNGCGESSWKSFKCDNCDYTLDRKCASLPIKVMRNRYDDHPLVLSFGEKNVDSDYWCEACETKVNPKEWFYTCHECGTILHISCVVGDFSYIRPGSHLYRADEEVLSNTSVCRPLCSGSCNSRCKLPSILKISKAGVDAYICSFECRK